MTDGDMELLDRYARENAEDAFTELVRRHLGLVHSAALRQVRSPELAQEVAQSVFTDLARNARCLNSETVLVAWLYQVTRRTAIDVVRRESRRQLREQVAHELDTMNTSTATWTDIEPILEEAMESLNEGERTAILLRYFENKSLRELGETLGTSEDAAQKRVSRALDRLHQFFAKKGVGVTTGGLALILSSNAVQAVSLDLTAAIAATAIHSGITLGASIGAGAIKTIAMTTLQKTALAAILAAAVGTGIYEVRQSAQMRTRIQHLEAQGAERIDKKIQQLTRERDDGARQLAALRNENAELKRNNAEIFKLRAEVTRLRSSAQASAEADNEDPAMQSALTSWLRRVDQLKQRVGSSPEANVPELKLLSEEDWLAAVKNPELSSEKDYKRAMASLRNTAQKRVAAVLQPALSKYLKENNFIFPTSVSQLQTYIEFGSVDAAILQRYSIVPADSIDNVKVGGEWAITQSAAVDEEFDQRIVIGPNGFGSSNWKSEQKVQQADIDILSPALKAYTDANNGHEPVDLSQLQPYLATPKQQDAFQRVLEARSKDGEH